MISLTFQTRLTCVGFPFMVYAAIMMSISAQKAPYIGFAIIDYAAAFTCGFVAIGSIVGLVVRASKYVN